MNIKLATIAVIIAAAITAPSAAAAGPTEVARVQLQGGAAIFELYLEPGLIPECRNAGLPGALAKLESPRGIEGYGSGCWNVSGDHVTVIIKAYDTGRVNTQRLHKSAFKPQ